MPCPWRVSSPLGLAMMVVTASFARLLFSGLTLYVAFLVTSHAAIAADERRDPTGDASDLVPQPDPVSSPLMPGPPYGPPPAPPFRDTQYGAQITPGVPGSPSYLHPNLPEYQTRYGLWYQPHSFWEPRREIYRPQPFRPRGFGNLFVDDPCRRDRMDYNRYVVKDAPSNYGPSYYPLYQPPSECLVRPERAYSPPVWGSAE